MAVQLLGCLAPKSSSAMAIRVCPVRLTVDMFRMSKMAKRDFHQNIAGRVAHQTG